MAGVRSDYRKPLSRAGRRLAKVKPDLLIARQGIKLKFNDFQLTTQEHVWPRLNKDDLIATAHKAWDERRGGRGVRLVGLHVTLLDPQLEGSFY
jgi:DNA polymerase-4